MLARFESIDKFDKNVIAFDCPEFKSIEASLYQVLHRTTSEPLIMVCSIREDRRDLKHGMQ